MSYVAYTCPRCEIEGADPEVPDLPGTAWCWCCGGEAIVHARITA